MVVIPERRISSCVITYTAAAVAESFCSFLDTDVIWMFISSSRLASAKSRGGGCVCGLPAQAGSARSDGNAASAARRIANLYKLALPCSGPRHQRPIEFHIG